MSITSSSHLCVCGAVYEETASPSISSIQCFMAHALHLDKIAVLMFNAEMKDVPHRRCPIYSSLCAFFSRKLKERPPCVVLRKAFSYFGCSAEHTHFLQVLSPKLMGILKPNMARSDHKLVLPGHSGNPLVVISVEGVRCNFFRRSTEKRKKMNARCRMKLFKIRARLQADHLLRPPSAGLSHHTAD